MKNFADLTRINEQTHNFYETNYGIGSCLTDLGAKITWLRQTARTMGSGGPQPTSGVDFPAMNSPLNLWRGSVKRAWPSAGVPRGGTPRASSARHSILFTNTKVPHHPLWLRLGNVCPKHYTDREHKLIITLAHSVVDKYNKYSIKRFGAAFSPPISEPNLTSVCGYAVCYRCSYGIYLAHYHRVQWSLTW